MNILNFNPETEEAQVELGPDKKFDFGFYQDFDHAGRSIIRISTLDRYPIFHTRILRKITVYGQETVINNFQDLDRACNNWKDLELVILVLHMDM